MSQPAAVFFECVPQFEFYKGGELPRSTHSLLSAWGYVFVHECYNLRDISTMDRRRWFGTAVQERFMPQLTDLLGLEAPWSFPRIQGLIQPHYEVPEQGSELWIPPHEAEAYMSVRYTPPHFHRIIKPNEPLVCLCHSYGSELRPRPLRMQAAFY